MKITELFEPSKDWQWTYTSATEAEAEFRVGSIPYQFTAFTNPDNIGVWEVEFKNNQRGPEKKTKFGLTGTGNAAEVMAVVVDIMREFLQRYQGSITSLSFSADEDSRQSLYARMVKRLLPSWNLTQQNKSFTITAPNVQMNEENKSARYKGYILKYAFNSISLVMKAYDIATKTPVAYVKFVKENKELYPQDLWVNDDFRSQGIAKAMYDHLKSEGFVINRSHDQTDAGSGFWDKHRGEDTYVWEEPEDADTDFKVAAK